MRKLIIYCTQLRKEEKAIFLEAKEQELDVDYCLVGNGFLPSDKNVVGIIRVLSHQESLAIANINQVVGNVTINTSDIIKFCTDKSLTAFFMKQHNIPQPRFSVAFSFKHLKEIIGTFHVPFVIKPISSSWGRGICLIEDMACLEKWLAGRESLNAAHNAGYPLFLQDYIDKPGFDIRVLVIGKEPVVAFKRVSDHWITNTHLGATIEPLEIDNDMRGILDKIIKALGSGFYGIDLFKTQDGAYLCNEINHNPDFSFSSTIHKVNIPQQLIKYIKNEYFA